MTNRCRKCNNDGITHKHHIIPFKNHYKDNRTIDICPNCHSEIHNLLPSIIEEKKVYESFFLSWIFGVFDKHSLSSS